MAFTDVLWLCWVLSEQHVTNPIVELFTLQAKYIVFFIGNHQVGVGPVTVAGGAKRYYRRYRVALSHIQRFVVERSP